MERLYRGYRHPSAYRLATELFGSGWNTIICKKPHARWFNEYHKLYTAFCRMDADLITATEEAKRLRYENEFMLRLIQEKDNDTKQND